MSPPSSSNRKSSTKIANSDCPNKRQKTSDSGSNRQQQQQQRRRHQQHQAQSQQNHHHEQQKSKVEFPPEARKLLVYIAKRQQRQQQQTAKLSSQVNVQTRVANKLICPITLELPYDPVTAEDGKIYERSAIKEHITTQKEDGLEIKSPVTKEPMGGRLIASKQTKNLIEKLIKLKVISGEIARKWIEQDRKEQDLKEQTIQEIKKKAKAGNMDAMVSLSLYYDKEKKNHRLSYEWAKKAADERHVKAMALVGCKLLQGGGVEQNIPEGMYFISIAAEQESCIAAFVLGRTYHKGCYGCPVDKKRAIYWYKKSLDPSMRHNDISENGKETAEKALEDLVESS